MHRAHERELEGLARSFGRCNEVLKAIRGIPIGFYMALGWVWPESVCATIYRHDKPIIAPKAEDKTRQFPVVKTTATKSVKTDSGPDGLEIPL